MLEPPPALVMTLPDVPADFTIERRKPLAIVPPRCGPSSANEIVICGQRDSDRHRLGNLAPRSDPTLMEDAADALTLKIGPVTIVPGGVKGARSTGVGVGIKIEF